MNFTLFYRGPLKSNGTVGHKHDIRSALHLQLKFLWSNEPLRYIRHTWSNPPDPDEKVEGKPIDLAEHGWLLRRVAGNSFVPLITSAYRCLADLEITMLRPCEPGGIIAAGGDIDNRLKTLFDALTLPPPNQVPKGWSPGTPETPLFCLLEDDKLISNVRISTATLLDPHAPRNEVVCLIRVVTRVSSPNQWNSLFG